MTTWNEWIEIQIEAAKIEKMKLNVLYWKARFHSENRWAGQIGEEAFRIFMSSLNKKFIDYTDKGANWVDFTFDKYHIDVKTIVTKYYPKENYGCNVDYDQHNNNDKANTYLFVRYIEPLKKTLILGIYSKDYFSKNSVLRTANSKVTDVFTPVKDFYEILISELQDVMRIIL